MDQHVTTDDQGYVWAPGTVRLENKTERSDYLVLQPKPTEDPNDPLNWTTGRKWTNFSIALLYVISTFVMLDIAGVAYGPYLEMGLSYGDLNNAIAANYAGLGLGCLFFIPFVYKYGRRPIYLFSLTLQLAVTLWAGWADTAAQFIVFNLFAGLGGAISETIVQITIADLFFVHQRGMANGIFLAMETIGSFLGPLVAGYIIQAQSWQYMWWWTALLIGINLILAIGLFEETKYVPEIGGQVVAPSSTASASKPTTTTAKSPEPSLDDVPQSEEIMWRQKSRRERLGLITKTDIPLFQHAWNPFFILIQFPAVTYSAIIYASLLVWVSVLGTVQSLWLLYPPYNFDSAQIGLFNLSSLVGTLIGAICGGPLNDFVVVRLSKRNSGIYEPEFRLYLGVPTAFFSAAGLLLFGFTLDRELPWIVLAVANALYCVGLGLGGDVALTYLMDCYQDILGDAFVGVAFLRNAVSVIIMFVITPWLDGMGLRNTFILCGALSFITLNVSIPMIIWGKKARIRTAGRYAHFAKLQPLSRDF
ncbi:hypothetical protein TMatcc_006583 [Talaromyces marneffei ATCC 18224]|uniref:Major facilitator superfamily (MFS) profile domain-containing protein n=2 Tax=Talaromyces marneffei TaxID=37727 RepID=B6QA03_TALMQ|nr:uncharacterized protein EYB26_002482 [Talaromyces marneffei]EEA25195.1 conserved hypothetical protein [Talaromyces marneffei ATCC 18224]KAE8553930.1 hypothetical protein EYB25_002468 [Talaromyces marneffei]QGA14826.1 hypothetical protein EYB26_002482 [Talaromyces marneffei]